MGHVQDEDGRKMSKHMGNVVDPFADAGQARRGRRALVFLHHRRALAAQALLRAKRCGRASASSWARCGTSTPSLRMYAQIDGFDPAAHPLEKVELSLMDKWMLSKLNSLIAKRGRRT